MLGARAPDMWVLGNAQNELADAAVNSAADLQ